MIKTISLLIFSCLYAAVAYGQSSYGSQQWGSQQWECALDLHQGDTGSLSLLRENDSVQGEIQLKRNSTVFTDEVTGSWYNNLIELNRLIGDDRSEQMSGVSIVLGTKKINLAGRYGADFQGVWSANCDLVSGSSAGSSASSSAPKNAVQIPSISSKVTPNTPSSKDSITFSTFASHPEGIAKITIFLGNKEVHSCESNQCDFKSGALRAGIYNWRIEAISNDGSKGEQTKNRLVVKDRNLVKNCRISGKAIGPSAPLASIYLVKLYGPNSKQVLAGSTRFNNGFYEFDNLSKGTYQLVIDTQADQQVLASPNNATLSCQSKAELIQNINFQ